MNKRILLILTLIAILTLSVAGCSTAQTEAAPMPATLETDTEEVPVVEQEDVMISGSVIEVVENGILLGTSTGNFDEVFVLINDETVFDDDVISDFQKGNLVVIEASGMATKSIPPQMHAKKILVNEFNDIVIIDEGETCSALIGGEYPEVILDRETREIEVKEGTIFAIKLQEIPSKGEFWLHQIKGDGIESTADGLENSTSDTVDSGVNHYFGFEAKTAGEYTIEFDLNSTSGPIKEQISYQVFVVPESYSEYEELEGSFKGLESDSALLQTDAFEYELMLYSPDVVEITSGIEIDDKVKATVKPGEAGYLLVDMEKIVE